MTRSPQFARSGLSLPRLLARAITHRPARVISVVAALAVGATLASAFLSLYFDLPAKMTTQFRSLGPNLLIGPPEQLREPSPAVLDEQLLPGLHSAAPQVEMLPWLYAAGQINRKPVVLAGTETARLQALHPSWRVTAVRDAGAAPDGQAAHGVLAGERALAAQGWSMEGAGQQWITIEYGGKEHTLPLRGVVSTGTSVDEQMILPLATLQEITARPGQISAIEARAPGDSAQVEQVRGTLQVFAGGSADILPLRPVLESQARIVWKVRGLMFGLTAVVLALVLLSVMTTISGLVMDRSREIGIMKALGGSDARILQLLMAETSLLAVAAAVAGYFAGFALARAAAAHMFAAAETDLLALRADVLAAVAGITVAVALAACALPARQMKRIDPAVILRGE